MTEPLRLAMKGIEKSFSGVQVLKKVDLELQPGRALALLGEYGAGKSTLMKILSGDYFKDAGSILFDGTEVSIDSPADAADQGVQIIYQELNYLPDVTVMENILLGHLPQKNRWFVDWEEAYRKASSILRRLGTDIRPDRILGQLSIADKQLVEISKALSKEAKIIVMDEPTAALTSKEVEHLFRVIRDLKLKGVSVIYITHHLDEVFEICDDVMIMRDGEKVGGGPLSAFTRETVIDLMVGRKVARSVRTDYSRDVGDVVLEAKDLTQRGVFHQVSFRTYQGEILGIFGLLGSGKESLSKVLFGAEPTTGGEMRLQGSPCRFRTPADAREAGVAYVPPDRKVAGLVLDMSVKDNLTLSSLHLLSSFGFVNDSKAEEMTQYWVDKLNIKLSGGIRAPIRFLSGGNQQKVILSRWLVDSIRLLVLCEPTMGVDVGAREDIYNMLKNLKNEGLSIIVVSSDTAELEILADRVMVISFIAAAMTFVIISGGIDLSVGSVVALTGVVTAQLYASTDSMALAVSGGLLIGVAVGLLNGYFITVLKINALITTLGMMSIARGLAFVLSGGLTETLVHPVFRHLGRGYVLGIPVPVIIMLLTFAIGAIVLRRTVFGRNIYAIGGNEVASRLAAIRVRKMKITIYLISGLSASLAGLILTSQLAAGAPQASTGLELSVIAAVILGGCSLMGGKGTIFGTFLGVLIMGTLNNGLVLSNVSSYYQEVARGAVLLLALAIDQKKSLFLFFRKRKEI